MKRTLATIGYQGRTQPELLRVLQDWGITSLLDVRLRPQSRKRGFSKTALSSVLAQTGIRYEHRIELGTPSHLLDSGPGYSLRSYREHLLQLPLIVASAGEAADRERTVLLCFESDPRVCHRSVVAEMVAEVTHLPVLHL